MSSAQNTFYKNLLESTSECFLVCDADFNIIYLNKAAEELIGFSSSETADKKICDIILRDKDSCPVCCSNQETSFVPKNFVHLGEIKNSSGSKIPVRISHSAIKAAEADEYEGFITVLTPLSELTFLNQAHLDFVSTVSHELRTPLTSIKGFAETLLNSGDMLNDEQKKRFIGIIKNQTDRLTRLVENLLTVSRLEGQKDKTIYKEIDFERFLNQLVQILAPKIASHKVELEIAPNLPPIWADSDKLEQIMTNLIDNAAKYSQPGTNIKISGNYAKDSSDFLEITVSDNGVGIPQEALSKIFTKFSRIDNPLTRNVEGTGLGLYITKTLVEKLGGQINAYSNGKGSQFVVKLPVATPEKHAQMKFYPKE